MASEESVGKKVGTATVAVTPEDLSPETKYDVAVAASHSFDAAMKLVVRAVIIWLVAVFMLFATALGLIYLKVDTVNGTANNIDATVTSHNSQLVNTLGAACILIKSDPKLPFPKSCNSAIASVIHAPRH